MTTLIDLNAEIAKLRMLEGRTPVTTREEREGTSAVLAPYRDGAIFTSKFSGKGAWERHPEGEELVHIIAGTATLDIVPEDGPPQEFVVGPGTLAVVPRGAWHRFHSVNGVTLMTATPQPSEHIRTDTDDPLSVAAHQA